MEEPEPKWWSLSLSGGPRVYAGSQSLKCWSQSLCGEPVSMLWSQCLCGGASVYVVAPKIFLSAPVPFRGFWVLGTFGFGD